MSRVRARVVVGVGAREIARVRAKAMLGQDQGSCYG